MHRDKEAAPVQRRELRAWRIEFLEWPEGFRDAA